MNYEYCIKCDCETGRAGAGEDSIYDADGGGPYCEKCWKEKMLTEDKMEDTDFLENIERNDR